MQEEHGIYKVAQSIIFKNFDDAILIVKITGINKWHLPGGRLNKNESWETGLRREVMEEISITDFKITGIHSVANWISHASEPHYQNFFIGEILSGKVVPTNEVIEVEWVKTLEELEQHEFILEHVRDVLIGYLKLD